MASVTTKAEWRGIRTDARTVAMLTELAALTPTMPRLTPTQGSYRTSSAYSADTHNGAGAVDISVTNLTVAQQTQVETLARRVGFAAWVRAAIPGLWVRHIHLIAVPPSGSRANDGALSSGAFAQVQDYYAGRNGLATRGTDSGVRAYVGQTWELYVAKKPKPLPTPSIPTTIKETPMALIDGSKIVYTDTLGKTVTVDQALPRGAWAYDAILNPAGQVNKEIAALHSEVAALTEKLDQLAGWITEHANATVLDGNGPMQLQISGIVTGVPQRV